MAQATRRHFVHFRDARILRGDEVVLEHVAGELTCRDKPNGRHEWYGYMDVPNERHIEPGTHLKIVLDDGREAEINASDLRGTELPGKASHAVEFFVCGDLRAPGRLRPTDHAPRRLGQ